MKVFNKDLQKLKQLITITSSVCNAWINKYFKNLNLGTIFWYTIYLCLGVTIIRV